MKQIEHKDLQPLAIGAAILGSGGGGATIMQERIVSHVLRQGAVIRLIEVDELDDDDLVVPIAFMGAPLVALEKLPSGMEAETLLEQIRKAYPGRRIVLMPAEIGGANAFTPLWIGGLHDLCVLDADSIGRAFPKLHMSVLNLYGIASSPAFLAESDGRGECLFVRDAQELERKAREICISMGSRALVALYLMPGRIAKKVVIRRSLSKAIAIGKDLCDAMIQKQRPVKLLAKKWNGKHLASGIIESIDYQIEGGFLKGSLRLRETGNTSLELHFINEFLAVERNGELVAATPEILTLLDEYTGKIVSTAEAKWGLSVDLLALPSPSIWNTKEGLECVGLEKMECKTCLQS